MSRDDRSYDQSCNSATDRISTVAPYDRSHDQSSRSAIASWRHWYASHSVRRRMGSDLNHRNISTFYSVREQSIGGTAAGRKVARPVARLIVRPLTIWNGRLQVLNMSIDLVATDLPLAITHDLCDQSYVLSTMWLRWQFFCRSYVVTWS